MRYAGMMFLAEHDLLEIYLQETENVIDKLVLVEANFTFTGNPKPWHYDEQIGRYAKWEDRIIHVRCTDVPANLSPGGRDKWNREQIMRGLGDVKDDDTIVVGDLDEIPRASAIANYRPSDGIRSLRMAQYYWFINAQAKDMNWDRCVIVPGVSIIGGWTPTKLRYSEFPIIENAGWHFSGMGGADKLAYKLKSFAHAGMAHHDNEVKWVRDGSIVNREHCTPITVVPIDESYPQFIRDNPSLMRDWKLICEPGEVLASC